MFIIQSLSLPSNLQKPHMEGNKPNDTTGKQPGKSGKWVIVQDNWWSP